MFLLLICLQGFSFVSAQNNSFDKMLDGLLRFSVPTIQPAELEAEILSDSTIVLIDARASREFEISHLKGAINLPEGEKELLSALPPEYKNKKIVIYCSVGYRSEKMAELFLETGFSNVKNLYGGLFLWNNEGRNMVDSQNKPTSKIHPYNSSWGKWIIQGEKTY